MTVDHWIIDRTLNLDLYVHVIQFNIILRPISPPRENSNFPNCPMASAHVLQAILFWFEPIAFSFVGLYIHLTSHHSNFLFSSLWGFPASHDTFLVPNSSIHFQFWRLEYIWFFHFPFYSIIHFLNFPLIYNITFGRS